MATKEKNKLGGLGRIFREVPPERGTFSWWRYPKGRGFHELEYRKS